MPPSSASRSFLSREGDLNNPPRRTRCAAIYQHFMSIDCLVVTTLRCGCRVGFPPCPHSALLPRVETSARGMDRQTLRDWVHRFNASGADGLLDDWTEGPKPRLSSAQMAEVARIVEAGPDREKDGVVRWRRIDLKRVIAERLGVDFHERYVGTLLKKLGFSHISARPRHPAQDERIVEAFKKRMARPVCKGFFESADDQSAATYPASEDSSQPRWRYAHSGPHKLPGVERRFLNQAFGAPFDCQAISISPLANLIDRSARFGSASTND